jgi:hypothetical protein
MTQSASKQLAWDAGIWLLITTNDNLLPGFYQKRGFRLVKVYLAWWMHPKGEAADILDRMNGIPIRG